MKKILFAALVLLSTSFMAQAQQVQNITFTGSDAATDTILNTGTVYLTSMDLTGKAFDAYDIQLYVVSDSGTSTFKAIIQETINGTAWTNVHGVAGTDGINCDTLQVTAGAPAGHIFRIRPGSVHSITDSTFRYTNAGPGNKVRIVCIGGAGQKTRVSAKGRARIN